MVECRRASPLHLPLRDSSKTRRALNYNSTQEDYLGTTDLTSVFSAPPPENNFKLKFSTNLKFKKTRVFFPFEVFQVNNNTNLCCRMFLKMQPIRTRFIVMMMICDEPEYYPELCC